MKKKKVSIPELYESLKSRGVTFNNHSKEEAMKIMEHTNYYYKLASFRKNFEKEDSKYKYCDFSYLVDLASIDMQVRNYLLEMSLSIEHFVKTEFTRQITAHRVEDGYSIVTEFRMRYPEEFERTLEKFEKTRYQKVMYEKHHHDLPIWVMMEHMDYGCLNKVIEQYYFMYNKPRSLAKTVKLSMSSRHIRNACAHNSVFIIEWFNNNSKIDNNPAEVTTLAKDLEIEPYLTDYAKVNDLLATFSLFKTYASKETVKHYHDAGLSLLERCKRNEQVYKKVPKLKKMYNLLSKMVDYLADV